MKPDEISVEVANGYVLIAVKIPTCTCDACGVVVMDNVTPESVKSMILGHHPITSAFRGQNGWRLIPGPKDDYSSICEKCAVPIAMVEATTNESTKMVHQILAAKISRRAGP